MTCASDRDGLLVHIFLRGGADGLSLVAPTTDDTYRAQRPTLAVAPPDEDGGGLDLDGTFALHPALDGLHDLWEEGGVTVLHAVGTDDTSRSHFEAQDHLEHGGARLASGWLGRHLQARGDTHPLAALAFGRTLPEALRGAPAVTVLDGLDDLPRAPEGGLRTGLARLYGSDPGPVGVAGIRTLEALDTLESLRDAPAPEGAFPDAPFGRHLRDLVTLVRADLGIRVACVDLGGWDTHFVQGALFAERARTLGDGLRALRTALGARWASTTVVVVSEFGRRIPENGSLGTDHGRGGAAFVLGGTVRGRRVITDWPGLAPGGVLDAYDLPVTLDARAIYAEVLCGALGQPDLDRVLPGVETPGLGVLG